MITVCKRFHFDAAHRLPKHQGKCNNLHGHRWFLDVELTGKIRKKGPSKGMILDFGDLKEIINYAVIEHVDHTYLNDVFKNPTAETMVQTFALWIMDALYQCCVEEPVTLTRLRLYETEDSYAEWRNDAVAS